MHWGRGSPSVVRAARFGGIMSRIARIFDLRPDAGGAVEIDPRHLADDFVAAMVRAVAAAFDGRLDLGEGRHAIAV